ncbi:hypothetical protein VNO78_22792 [Psophocarpus tetragonolobus]|uniref:Uncharacterized protein n=1 Tax=Psophocarpus tetragonolobus TaxID=3891 RepID=A0AAN9S5I0_PSOTE
MSIMTYEHACKSKRITWKFNLSVEFSDEDEKLYFLKDLGMSGSIKDGKMKLNSGKRYKDWNYVEEDPTSSDESIPERMKPKMESIDLLGCGKECPHINHNLSC